MTQAMIETKQLTKCYHAKPVVDHLDISVPEGAIYGFLGPNGAGKSTTMKMLLGLISRDRGTIVIGGKEMNDMNRISILKQVGSLIENPSYYGNLITMRICRSQWARLFVNRPVLSIVRLDGQKRRKAHH
ncbi:MAG: ATP-binding cassette domain-containing protein [Enterocloster bolteae]|uniref:ATP-binding cassette domain-containing protein n=1 Tax=Enterocloster bolteae TaxID=208479 RepID=UPI00399487D9